RIFRNAVKRPGLQRSGERFLHHVFGQGEMLEPENPRQSGDHLSRFMPEKMFHHLGHFLWFFAVELGWTHSLLRLTRRENGGVSTLVGRGYRRVGSRGRSPHQGGRLIHNSERHAVAVANCASATASPATGHCSATGLTSTTAP